MSSSYHREYWKIVKMLVKDNTNENEIIPPLKNCNNTFSLSDIDKANTLNEFFSSISCVDDTNIKLPLFTFKTNSRLEDFIIMNKRLRIPY
jgi:serine protease inhibitor